MNNAKNSLDHPDLAHNAAFDNALMIFTTVFFLGLFYWCFLNYATESVSPPLQQSNLVSTNDIQQPLQYSNLFFGIDMNKIESTVTGMTTRRTPMSRSIATLSHHKLRTETNDCEEQALISPEIVEPISEVESDSKTYILNKSLANNEKTGAFDLLDDVDLVALAETAEKNEGFEVVDGSELLMISLNEMHLIKLPGNTDMAFIESDGNEFADEKKVVISAEEKKATLDAVKEVVKGDELAFISENELDEIKIVENKNNNSTTNELVAKGIQNRSLLLFENMEIASVENKVIMISFGAKWCMPCREMYKKVFPHPDVKSLIDQHYLSLKLDANDLEAISLKQLYDVKTYPTTLFLFPNGEEMNRFEEGISIDKMLTILNQNTLQNHPEYPVGNSRPALSMKKPIMKSNGSQLDSTTDYLVNRITEKKSLMIR